VNEIPLPSLRNRKLHKPLTNKMNAAIKMVSDGALSDARDKLRNDVRTKTDGCAKTGAPDKNDWITDCDAQAMPYSLLSDAIALLDGAP